MQEWTRTSLYRSSAVLSRVHEVLTCVRLVKSSNTEAEECALYREANRQLVKSSMRAVRVGSLVAPIFEFIGVGLLCAFFGWCFSAEITLQQILPMMAPLLVVYKPVKKLSKLQVQIENTMAALNRLFSLLDVHMELPERSDPVPKKEFTECIRFENVSFRYDTAQHDAVKSATFGLPCGKVVAVVGGTGSGKTTMSALLARFLDPTSGRVTIDGVDLRDISFDDLRSLIGVVTQEAVLFNDSIEENIKYGSSSADHSKVTAAAALANASEFIAAHPDGYARYVGEKGFSLSGGERQRLAIARALVKNPPILILDEATSALDTVTERQVQAALDNLMKGRTSFVIAHRLSTIRNADMILVMKDGEIVERGTHEELVALEGVYKNLCDMQAMH
jgi:subfamily B ATP-binding cassette protein MsbA